MVTIPSVCHDSCKRSDQECWYLACKCNHSQHQCGAGKVVNQPGGGNPLYPGSDQRNALSAEEQTVVSIFEGPKYCYKAIIFIINVFHCNVNYFLIAGWTWNIRYLARRTLLCSNSYVFAFTGSARFLTSILYSGAHMESIKPVIDYPHVKIPTVILSFNVEAKNTLNFIIWLPWKTGLQPPEALVCKSR